MNKQEIIQNVACCNVPAGSSLVERSDPITGLSFAHITPENLGGLHVIRASLLIDMLTDGTKDLDDAPDAKLFRCLHSELVAWNKNLVNGTMIEAASDQAIEEHKKCVEQLEIIAGSLGIEYEPPDDPFLD
ncbi:hypothetical protein KGP36_05260 [Patescibacteria group bacterium]|nr:hypothetical protein [Patescibacteria group bacterium]MDE1941142.1 hypothetical protein [Patescibacteria group bacterium]